MINNRQAGRRRGRGGGNNGGGQRGGGNQGNGSRIDNRARGNANQLYEKYKNMAADAQRAGDRVNTEYYLQFADHYFRVLSEQRGRFEEQQPRRGRDDFDFDGEEEFGDEGEPVRTGEQDGARFEERGREDRAERAERQRDDRPRGERGDRDGGREVRRDRDGGREGGEGRQWQDRPRGERRPEQPVEVAGQRRAEPLAAGESLETRAEEVLEADRPLEAPTRRRGRPRREEAPAAADGDGANGFEADRLPPSLTPSLSVAANDEAPEPKPRRRRTRPAEETPTAAE